MPLTSDPFGDQADALLESQPPRSIPRRFCPLSQNRASLIQRPPRAHQVAVPSMTRNGSDFGHSRQATDLSQRTTDLEEAGLSRYRRTLVSPITLWSTVLVGELSLLSTAAAVAILFRSIASKDVHTSTCVWLTISFILALGSAIAGIFIYKAREKRKTFRLLRGGSLDSQFRMKDLNSHQNHPSTVSEAQPPQPFEQSDPTKDANRIVAAEGIGSRQNVPPHSRLRERQQATSLQKVQSRENVVQHQENANARAGCVKQILRGSSDPQNQAPISNGLPAVLFGKQLVHLPNRQHLPSDQTSRYYGGAPEPFNESLRDSRIDLDAAFDSTMIHQEETGLENCENLTEDSFVHHHALDKYPDPDGLCWRGKVGPNPFDTAESAISATESPPSRFATGSSKSNSLVEYESPDTPYDKLRQFSVSPSYSHAGSDKGNVDCGELLYSDDAVMTLTFEEREMLWQQKRRCFSTQNNLWMEEDSRELDEIFNQFSQHESSKGKGKEVAGRPKSFMAGDRELGMEADAFAPLHRDIRNQKVLTYTFPVVPQRDFPQEEKAPQEQGPMSAVQLSNFPQSNSNQNPGLNSHTHSTTNQFDQQSHPFSASSTCRLEPVDESQPSIISQDKALKSAEEDLQLNFNFQGQIHSLPSQLNPEASHIWIRGLPTKVTARDWKGDEIPMTVKPWRKVSKAVENSRSERGFTTMIETTSSKKKDHHDI